MVVPAGVLLFLLSYPVVSLGDSAISQLGDATFRYGVATTIPNFTVPAGRDRLLVVVVGDTNSTGVVGVSYDGTSMTEVVELTDGFAVDAIYVLPLGDSDAATNGVIVADTGGAAGNTRLIAAVAFDNVDQSDPTGATGKLRGNQVGAITLSSEAGDLVFSHVDTFRLDAVPSLSPGAGQAVLFDASGSIAAGGFGHYQASIEDGAASVVSSWSSNATAYIHLAFDINAAYQTRTGTITVVNDTQPDSASEFSYTIDGGLSPAGFVLSDATGSGADREVSFTNVPEGGYVLEAVAQSRYETGLSCTDSTGDTVVSNLAATIQVAPGDEVICTYTHALRSSLDPLLQIIPAILLQDE